MRTIILCLALLGAAPAASGAPFPDERSRLSTLNAHAEAGDAMAQYTLAEQIMRAPAPDFSAAAHWYREAAEQGHSGAQIRLARLYAQGRGVRQDVVLAYHWFDLASRFNADAARSKVELARNMSLTQIQRAEALTRRKRDGEPIAQAPRRAEESAFANSVFARRERRPRPPVAAAPPPEVPPGPLPAPTRPTPGSTPAQLPESGPETGPKRAPTPPAGLPPTVESGFMAQIGSFTDEANALELAHRLEAAAIPVQMQRVTVKGRGVTRLRVGPYETMALARAAQHHLKSRFGLSSWVVPPGY